MVIFNHILSRISRPESGSCITLTIVAMSLFTVKGDSSNSKRKKGYMLLWNEPSLKRTFWLPIWMKHFKTQLYQQLQKKTQVPKCINGINYSICTNSSEIVLSATSLVTEMLSPYMSWLHKPAIDQHCTLSIHTALRCAEKETQGVLWPLLSISICHEQPLPTQRFSVPYAKLCRTGFFGLFFNFWFNCQE